MVAVTDRRDRYMHVLGQSFVCGFTCNSLTADLSWTIGMVALSEWRMQRADPMQRTDGLRFIPGRRDR